MNNDYDNDDKFVIYNYYCWIYLNFRIALVKLLNKFQQMFWDSLLIISI